MSSLEDAQFDGLGEGQDSSERQQLQRLLKAIIPYLPHPVVDGYLADPDVRRVKGEYWEGSVLFADLSGFTALSETLSKLGKQGSEEITRIVNDLFEALLEDVERYGGVLVKFGGDALTVFFGGDAHALRAVHAGLTLQETMGRRFVNLGTPGGVFTLRLRVGVHTGKIFAAQVGYEPGYPLRGMELVVTGADINRVAEAQDQAAPGQVFITAETLSHIAAQANVEPVAGGMYRLDALSPSQPLESSSTPSPRMPMDEWPLPTLRMCLQALRPYLPVDLADERITDPTDPELRPDLRPVAVLFANFADLSAILSTVVGQGEAGVRAATRILNMYYARMQEVIGRYGGVVNKVDMYTHGDKLMATFGAPLAHEDDAERAVRVALEMQAAMPEVNRYVQQVL
jgi:class 3 adenylate cyclase